MECNKDEAKRAMEIAEKKLSENDYVGAKKFVIKAQTLYPNLDGLQQLMMMIDVYTSASNKINGGREADWYGVLGVDHLADVETVKRQYKKLALLLHPDKNRFNGAEGAFKLVLNAWCLLSDKAKRFAYDQRRKLNTGMQKKPPPNQHEPASSNVYQNARDGVDPNARARSNQPASGPQRPPYAHKPASSSGNQNARDGVDPNARARSNQPASGPQRPPYAHKPASSSGNQNARDDVDPNANTRSNKDAPVSSSNQWKGGTFWAMCNECKTRCEYRRDSYLNKAVLCPNCAKTYIATEKTPLASNVRPGNLSSSLQQHLLRRLEQWNAKHDARNKDTNGASSSGTNPSPSVGVTEESPSESSEKRQRQEQLLRARHVAEILRRSFGATRETPHASFVRSDNLSSSCPQQQQQQQQRSVKSQETKKNTSGASSFGVNSMPSASATQETSQASARSQATNKNTNGASSSGRVSSPSVSATAKTARVSSVCPKQQQWSAQNTSGGTSYPSSSVSFHQNTPVSVTDSSNSRDAANQTQESSKRVLEESSQETFSAAEKVSKKLRTYVSKK